jgi:hypothetical protein
VGSWPARSKSTKDSGAARAGKRDRTSNPSLPIAGRVTIDLTLTPEPCPMSAIRARSSSALILQASSHSMHAAEPAVSLLDTSDEGTSKRRRVPGVLMNPPSYSSQSRKDPETSRDLQESKRKEPLTTERTWQAVERAFPAVSFTKAPRWPEPDTAESETEAADGPQPVWTAVQRSAPAITISATPRFPAPQPEE